MISFLHKKISANSFAFIGILGFLDYLLTQLFEQSPRLHVSIVLCSRVSFLKVSSFKMPRWSSMLYFYTIFLVFLLCAISKLHDYSVYAAKIGNAPMIRNWYFSTFCFFYAQKIWFHLSHTPPRSSAPRRSLCLVSGSATAATILLRNINCVGNQCRNMEIEIFVIMNSYISAL